MLLHELQLPSPLENEQKLFGEQLVESVHAFKFRALFVVIVETVVDEVLDKTVNNLISMLVEIEDRLKREFVR